MSLDFYLEETKPCQVYRRNITHNLAGMASEAGVYLPLWHPEDIHYTKAKQLIPDLQKGLQMLVSDPDRFKKFESPNGWGTYPNFVKFVEDVLNACIENPEADVRTCT